MAWNGDLATVKSQHEDSLLLHSIVTIQNVSCFIGLNNRANNAMTNVSAYVWVDGSDSTYRQFGDSLGESVSYLVMDKVIRTVLGSHP